VHKIGKRDKESGGQIGSSLDEKPCILKKKEECAWRLKIENARRVEELTPGNLVKARAEKKKGLSLKRGA